MTSTVNMFPTQEQADRQMKNLMTSAYEAGRRCREEHERRQLAVILGLDLPRPSKREEKGIA